MNMNPNPERQENVKAVSLRVLQLLVFNQANELFPNRTPSKAWMKLYEEMGEVIKKPSDRLEWADVFILLFDLAKIHGVTDLQQAVLDKMAINQGRTWIETATGTMQHTNKEED